MASRVCSMNRGSESPVPVRCAKAIPPFLPGKAACAGDAAARATAPMQRARTTRRSTSKPISASFRPGGSTSNRRGKPRSCGVGGRPEPSVELSRVWVHKSTLSGRQRASRGKSPGSATSAFGSEPFCCFRPSAMRPSLTDGTRSGAQPPAPAPALRRLPPMFLIACSSPASWITGSCCARAVGATSGATRRHASTPRRGWLTSTLSCPERARAYERKFVRQDPRPRGRALRRALSRPRPLRAPATDHARAAPPR